MGWGRLEEGVPSVQLCKYRAEVFSALQGPIMCAGCKHSLWVQWGHSPMFCKPINSLVPQEELSEIKTWFVAGTLENGGSHCLVSHPTPAG